MPILRSWLMLALAVNLWPGSALGADETVFSGPQPGEPLVPFVVRGVFDEAAGKELDFVTQANGKPLVLIFVHDLNRQSISMTRILSSYTVSRAGDGLVTGVVWLDDDATEAENTLKRIRHALAPGAPTGISVDGREGPGAYGLNRNVMLTILVGNHGKVTANFALIQPSLQVDLPKMLEQIVAVAGGAVPQLEDLPGVRAMMRRQAASEPDDNLRALLRQVIRRDAAAEQVDEAARRLEEYLDSHESARVEVGRIANTIIVAGNLTNYGTERAQEYLRKWAKDFGTPNDAKAEPGPDTSTEKQAR
jgi:hypothetical protein